MDKGIYCLVVKNPACTVEVGALGPLPFAAGWHGYIGSALGTGGLVRLERHLRLAEHQGKRPKWHIDYLLSDRRFSVAFAVSAPTTERLECRLAALLARSGKGVDRFGCSDCSCPSHLLYWRKNPKEEILAAFAGLGLYSGIKTIITPKGKGNV